MKIGIFSGSFDPVHTGHAIVANYLAQFSELDEVWLMPSPLNPLKCNTPPSAPEIRLDMCRIVASKCERVKASDFELSLPVPSYTYRTLTELKNNYPDDDFYLIIGSDNWRLFSRWRNSDKIMSEFKILIYPRPGYDVDGILPENVSIVEGDAPQTLISSTFIRKVAAEKRCLSYFLDADVIDYIKTHHLYE